MNLDRAATLLASGLKPGQVATILGVSPARISQVVATEEFQLLLASKQQETEKEDIEEQAISAKYSAAEHVLLNQVMELAPTAELRDITAALRTVAERQEKMKTRTSVQAPVLHQQLTVVSVSLPSHALKIPEVHMNTAREVVAIGDRQLAPMTSDGVVSLFNNLAKKGDSHELPTSSSPTEESPAEAVPAGQVTETTTFLAYAGK